MLHFKFKNLPKHFSYVIYKKDLRAFFKKFEKYPIEIEYSGIDYS